jgi:hypothetical protein
MENSKQPINPSMWTKCGDGEDDYIPLKDGTKTGWEVKFGGLTKREEFARSAMQGLLMEPNTGGISTKHILKILGLSEDTEYDYLTHYPKYLAKLSIIYADELLNQLNS